MTREEAIEFGNIWLQINEDCKDSSTYAFFQMATQSLAREPCEDVISRQVVLDMLEDINAETEGVGFYYEHYVEYIKKLPPVKPQPKTGHWIEIAKYSDGNHKIECSECKSHIFDRGHANSFNVKNKYKYCPNCGAKMERSDKE